MFSKLKNYFRLLRITNWLKNIFVFVPLVFSKHLFDINYIYDVLIGFFAFSFTSSFVYVFNDIFDAERDRLHPLKKDRPIASGTISKPHAVITLALLLIIIGFFSIYLQKNFVLTLWAYIVINIVYTLYLKKIVIADIFCIAAGFLLRVIAGAFIILVYLSNWLILTTIFLSLFLAVMKRRVEIASNTSASDQRVVLKDYSLDFIDLIAAITATCVILSYALYTVAERTIKAFGSEELVFTTLFVIFGIFRYMFLAIKKNRGENVVELLLTDLPMLINIFLFITAALYIIYF
ncbi:MAG: decaprenyl-phosphate phosphoribosyltransferase [Melioribacteraceae bacterium]|nr:decaprenyl-phosphate phosphoribosyltransferase [Melioribacteraceae bacterium]